MSRYHAGVSQEGNNEEHRIAILILNLGTPDGAEPTAIRRFLAEFLWDPRVVESSRPLWWVILNGIILHRRPRQRAKEYASMWSEEEGFPLLSITRKQAKGLGRILSERFGDRFRVIYAMRYGSPAVNIELQKLAKQGFQRLLVLPLFPQYSATTTASAFDAVVRELGQWRRIPEVRFVHGYHTHPDYLDVLSQSIRNHWSKFGRSQRLLFSFHGIPTSYVESGDPYPVYCRQTAEQVAKRLQLDASAWEVVFHSSIGRKPWTQPYTDKVLEDLPHQGVASVDVICPGFSADCLETLEEIGKENRDLFLKSGGTAYHYIPALNEDPAHLEALSTLVEKHAQGWKELAE
ncbi:MAG: ferrochelatase [Arenicellales bacterium]|jgi:ferrochelatase|nr:ferrochelatase [Arenicellales bacterium]MDP7284032.1 ferrochelatase [Arenicellales bacterium]MEE1539822.1 ferrochelatase [Arenicellales bacterium]HJL66318.1 ferrochelatase [Arenicellales bacterium]|tara:strand:+ start:2076 stop:3119 length:1044 start_codon:yes stop_codon:yes gene_type:complete